MDFKTIILKREGGIATITLNRPEVLNGVSEEMGFELAAAVDSLAEDTGTRVVLVTGAGRAFCAGGDVDFSKFKDKEHLTAEDIAFWPSTRAEVRRGVLPPQIQKRVMLGLQNLPIPTIAVVNGVAAGFGYDLALACDIRLGSPKSTFVIGYTGVGVAPDSGGTWFMPRIMGIAKALEFLYTGEPCLADEAYRIGLLNRIIPVDQLQEEAMKFAGKVLNGAPIAFRLSKFQVYKGLQMDLETALGVAMACVTIATDSADHVEALKAFANKRAPRFQGK